MLTLRSTMFAPPGGEWFFEVDGIRLASRHSLVDLERAVVAHYEGRGKTVPLDLRVKIEDFMCRRLPEGNCLGEGARIPGSVVPSYFDLMKNLSRVRGKPLVDAKLAEARALTCRECRHNNMSGCRSCDNLQGQALTAVGGRQVLNLPYMGNCLVYVVPTYALVWVKNPGDQAGLPDNCWARGL